MLAARSLEQLRLELASANASQVMYRGFGYTGSADAFRARAVRLEAWIQRAETSQAEAVAASARREARIGDGMPR